MVTSYLGLKSSPRMGIINQGIARECNGPRVGVGTLYLGGRNSHAEGGWLGVNGGAGGGDLQHHHILRLDYSVYTLR